jgi:hypothetical protein
MSPSGGENDKTSPLIQGSGFMIPKKLTREIEAR